MKKKTVTYIFIFFILYLPLQYAMVGIVGYYQNEPWPAFVLPGFKSVHVYDDGYQVEQNQFEIYTDSESNPHVVRPRNFFPEVPLSQLPALMRGHFRSEILENREFSDDAVQWLQNHARQATGADVVKLNIIEVRKFYSDTTPGSEPDSVKQVYSRSIEFK